jgi:hypothetical protein
MAPMRLLIHVAGEADLLLDSQKVRNLRVRAERIGVRLRQLAASLDGTGHASSARDLLCYGGWNDGHDSTPAPSPLLGALATIDAAPGLDVVVLGTSQEPPDPLDMLPVARLVVNALNAGVAASGVANPVRHATVVRVPGMTEAHVAAALAGHLDRAPRYQHTMVTWGAGSTALAMGVLTALSRAGLRWQLVPVSGPTADPLEGLDTDPVAGVLVRWRMFGALDDFATQDPPVVPLTAAQHDLVRRAAERHRAGLEARDCANLRAVLADAVVRRDGTASLAVRRYITRHYEELLATDRTTHPWAKNLLEHVADPQGGGPPIGALLGRITERYASDPVIQRSVGLPSYNWLFTEEVGALQGIGRGSHTLRPPSPADARTIGRYLSGYDTDGPGWRDAGLPDPATSPADTVLAVWLAGVQSAPPGGTVGQQLIQSLPTAVVDYLGLDRVQTRAVIFGVPGEEGSLHRAHEDSVRMCDAQCDAGVEPIDTADVQRAVESRLTQDTAALLFIPTGSKQHLPTLLHAMRCIGARQGLPLFVRQTANPGPGNAYTDVYLWPALTGGDLALLVAARETLQTLELDVSWRLLAASGIDPDVTEDTRQLAAAFASRHPAGATPAPDPAGTTGRIAQRLALVHAALAHVTTSADRIRLLVLAADVLEASIAAMQPPTCQRRDSFYKQFRRELQKIARGPEGPPAQSARTLLLLNKARDRAPITHGTETDPDSVVAQAADVLARKWSLSPAASVALARDVSTLLSSAATAAVELGFGGPDQPNDLLSLHQRIDHQIALAIRQRERWGRGTKRTT